jgi:hypothetical protein
MTLVSLPSSIAFPGRLISPYGLPAVATAATVSSAGHYYSVVACAKENMVISHVGFRAGAATGSMWVPRPRLASRMPGRFAS